MRIAHLKYQAAVLALVLCGCGTAWADSTVNTGYFGGVAIMGYDPVAYFTENRAVKGSDKYAYDWLGTPWHFASVKNREMFMSEPTKYAPQYGGYCAGEVAGGSVTVNIDPEAFRIIDGKLYLIYDEPDAETFAANAEDLLPKAEENWVAIKPKLTIDKFEPAPEAH